MLWAFSFPLVGILIWGFLFGMVGGILKNGGPGRMKTAADFEGFSVLTGMLLALVLGGVGGVGGWIWPAAGTLSALGHVALAVGGAACVAGILLWVFGVPHWTLV